MSKPHSNYSVQTLSGRYITLNDIEPLLALYNANEISKSVQGLPLYRIEWGSGPVKIFMWSQMHGNESTTTKAVFDLLAYLNSNPSYQTQISLRILPMVNPDGAVAYTRNNANDVDLNRDAKQLSQPESQFLRDEFDDFKPHYAFNLHDQRTMYGVGDKPATISFLAPSADENRLFGSSRTQAASLIAQVAKRLYAHIPNQIGRYDDAFNPNCTGDAFQSAGVPTLLFEAGHYQDDYEREDTRKFVFYALQYALDAIVQHKSSDLDTYLQIPENEKRFFDVLIRDTAYNVNGQLKQGDIGINFKEAIQDGKFTLKPVYASEGDLSNHKGHREIGAVKTHLINYAFNKSAQDCL